MQIQAEKLIAIREYSKKHYMDQLQQVQLRAKACTTIENEGAIKISTGCQGVKVKKNARTTAGIKVLLLSRLIE